MELDKTNVLISILTNLRSEQTALRDRLIRVITAFISISVLFIGWIIQSKVKINIFETVSLAGIALIFWVATVMLINQLLNSYYNNRNVLIRIETCLKFYTPDEYSQDGSSLFPEGWQTPVKANKINRHTLLVSFTALITIVILIVKSVI